MVEGSVKVPRDLVKHFKITVKQNSADTDYIIGTLVIVCLLYTSDAADE